MRTLMILMILFFCHIPTATPQPKKKVTINTEINLAKILKSSYGPTVASCKQKLKKQWQESWRRGKKSFCSYSKNHRKEFIGAAKALKASCIAIIKFTASKTTPDYNTAESKYTQFNKKAKKLLVKTLKRKGYKGSSSLPRSVYVYAKRKKRAIYTFYFAKNLLEATKWGSTGREHRRRKPKKSLWFIKGLFCDYDKQNKTLTCKATPKNRRKFSYHWTTENGLNTQKNPAKRGSIENGHTITINDPKEHKTVWVTICHKKKRRGDKRRYCRRARAFYQHRGTVVKPQNYKIPEPPPLPPTVEGKKPLITIVRQTCNGFTNNDDTTVIKNWTGTTPCSFTVTIHSSHPLQYTQKEGKDTVSGGKPLLNMCPSRHTQRRTLTTWDTLHKKGYRHIIVLHCVLINKTKVSYNGEIIAQNTVKGSSYKSSASYKIKVTEKPKTRTVKRPKKGLHLRGLEFQIRGAQAFKDQLANYALKRTNASVGVEVHPWKSNSLVNKKSNLRINVRLKLEVWFGTQDAETSGNERSTDFSVVPQVQLEWTDNRAKWLDSGPSHWAFRINVAGVFTTLLAESHDNARNSVLHKNTFAANPQLSFQMFQNRFVMGIQSGLAVSKNGILFHPTIFTSLGRYGKTFGIRGNISLGYLIQQNKILFQEKNGTFGTVEKNINHLTLGLELIPSIKLGGSGTIYLQVSFKYLLFYNKNHSAHMGLISFRITKGMQAVAQAAYPQWLWTLRQSPYNTLIEADGKKSDGTGTKPKD